MLLNLIQTAEKLGISQTSVKRLIEAGTLPTVPYGKTDVKRRALRFDENVVKSFRKAGLQYAPKPATDTPVMLDHDPKVPAGYISAVEAAKIVGWKYQRLCDMVKTERVTALEVGKRNYFSPDEVARIKTLPKVGPIRAHIVPVSSNGHGTVVPASVALPSVPPSGITAFANRINNIDTRLNGIENSLATLTLAIQDLVKAFA